MEWSGRALAPLAVEAGQECQDKGMPCLKRTNIFRSAEIEGGEVTLWIKNCLAVRQLARQLYAQLRTRRR